MKFYPSSVSFASGELSPTLSGRVDLAAYSIGAKELTNLLVLPQGGLINRPGTKMLGAGGSALFKARLIPFIFNATTAFVIVYRSEGYITVHNQDGSKSVEISGLPYTTDELEELRWLQSADVLYLFHRNKKVRKLSRYSETDWRIEEVTFKNGPYQDMNTDLTGHLPLLDSGGNSIDISEVTMEIVTDEFGVTRLKSSVPYFTTNHVGLLFKVEFKVPSASGHITLRYPGLPSLPVQSEVFEMFGPSTITTTGTWTGTVTIERELPNVSGFSTVASKSSYDDANLGYQEDVKLYGTKYRVTLTRPDGSGVTTQIQWSSAGGLIARDVLITGYQDSQTMIVESRDEVETDTGQSLDWAFGAFGGILGYPSLGIFHQERLVLANSLTQKQTLWFSRAASWEDFGTELPLEDTDSITVTLAAKQIDEIVGLSSRNDLIIFTVGGEWVASAGKQNDVFTPSSITITPSSYHGSHNIAPLEVASYVLFVQRHGKTVRGLGYQLEIDGYGSNDMSILSSHLFEDTRIRRWDYQQEPWSIVWVVLESGVVLALTVQEEHKVTAWTRCVFPARIRDVCCIPGDTEDRVFFLSWGEDDGSGEQAILLMMNIRNDKNGYDKATYMDFVYNNNINGAFPYVSSFEGMELEENANGSLQGRFKQVPAATIRVYRTEGFHAGIMTENSKILDKVKFQGQLSPETLDSPYTGDINISTPGGVSRLARVRIENREPVPITILAVYRTVDINDE